MANEVAQEVLTAQHPRGLKRFVLLVLALAATEGGQLPFGEADQRRLADQLRMDVESRFSRIVEELRYEGFLSLDGSVLTLYAGGPQGAAVGLSHDQPSLLPQTSVATQGVKGGSEAKPQDAVIRVLACYSAQFSARKWSAEDRREVRAALEVASVEEIEEAIKGNRLSGFHQGENEHGKKYNTLGHIIRPKQGKRTRRENIDMFRDIYQKAKATTGGSVKAQGADPAVITTRKEEVRRAFRLQHDEEAQERGRRAETWLREQGIETTRRPDGYPLWPEGGRQ